MSAIAIVDQAYPFIYIHFQGASTLEDTHNFLARFEEWLSRQESFSLVLRQTAIENESILAEEHHKVHRSIAQWAMRSECFSAKQRKPQIANYCVGMAMVTDSTEAFKAEKNKISKMIDGVFGCPGKAFQKTESGKEWLESLSAKLS